jgi:hypothetical protein
MSDEQAKVKHSKRLQQKENHVARQAKILKEFSHGEQNQMLKEPHRLAKRHALNCGNPKCVMCANPRKTFKELTIQEKRHFQELEVARLRHSNGVEVDEVEEYLKVRNGEPATY